MKIKQLKNTIDNRVLLILVIYLPLLAYVFLRAYHLSLTHDESLSYSFIEGINNGTNSANNHLLNTHLMQLFSTVFGNKEFVLRLPNVLSFIIYLTGCFYIFKANKNNWLFLLGTGLMLLNPFLLEFFSLARGYGLSIACMLISLFFLTREEKQITNSLLLKDFIFSVLFASLAMYANLSMINFLIGIIVIFTIRFWLFKKNQKKPSKYIRIYWYIVLGAFVPLVLGIIRLLKLMKSKELYFGASTFSEGLSSLISSSIYFTGYPLWIVPFIQYSLLSILLLGIILIAIKKEYSGKLFTMTALILILLAGLFLENIVFSAKYPTERTALLYLPIISLFSYYLCHHIIVQYKINRTLYVPIVLCMVILLAFNFFIAANLTHTKPWKYDAHTKDTMKMIQFQIHTQQKYPVTISNHWLFEPTINYYINTLGLKLKPANRKGVNEISGYIYKFNDSPPPTGYKLLQEYNDINCSLWGKTKAEKKQEK